MFSWPSFPPVGDPNPRDVVIERVKSASFLMEDDGRAQSKENKALMGRLAVVTGIPTWGWAAQFASLTLLREVPQDRDCRRCCCGLPWTYPAWLHLRAQEWGAVRWGMTARAKEISG